MVMKKHRPLRFGNGGFGGGSAGGSYDGPDDPPAHKTDTDTNALIALASREPDPKLTLYFQRQLNLFRPADQQLPENGSMTDRTRKAILDYVHSRGLEKEGLYDVAKHLREEVRDVQEAINKLNGDQPDTRKDGLVGEDTKRAVQNMNTGMLKKPGHEKIDPVILTDLRKAINGQGTVAYHKKAMENPSINI